jgi:hypothetical protein
MRFNIQLSNYVTNKRQIRRGKLIVYRAALNLVANYFHSFTTLKASVSQCARIDLRFWTLQSTAAAIKDAVGSTRSIAAATAAAAAAEE